MDYVPILAYHKVDSRRELGITSVSPGRFQKQMTFLRNEGYTSLAPQALMLDSEKKENNISSQTPNKSVVITFDDGYEGVYTYAYPILKECGSTAIIFVTTGYIGEYNNWDSSPGPRFKHLDWTHIREMANDGILFGSHGVNHTFLTRQNDSVARYEIEASKKKLEDGLGSSIRFFSYPYGDYNDRIKNLVQEAGYDAAFSLRPELLRDGFIHADNIRYTLPRIAIYLVDNMRAFRAKTGYFRRGSLPYTQKIKNLLINRCGYASMLVNSLKSQV